jgi:hypothetical protein
LTALFGGATDMQRVTLSGRMVAPSLRLVVGVCTALPTAHFVGLADMDPVAVPTSMTFTMNTAPLHVSECAAAPQTFILPAAASQTGMMPSVVATAPLGVEASFLATGPPGSLLTVNFGLTACVADGGVATYAAACCTPGNFSGSQCF